MNFMKGIMNGVKKFFGIGKETVAKGKLNMIPVEEKAGSFTPRWGMAPPHTLSRKAWKLRKNRLHMAKESRKKNRPD